MIKLLFLCFLCLFLRLPAWGQAPIPPEGWTSTRDKIQTTLIPPGLARNQVYQLIISETEPSTNPLDAFYEGLWKALVGTRKVTRQPVTNSPVLEGWNSRQGIGVVAAEKISLFVNLAAYERDGKRMGVFVLTTSTDLYKQYADTQTSVVTATLHARAGGAAKNAQDKPDKLDKTIQPAAKQDQSPFVDDKGRVNRVVEIAHLLQDPKSDAITLLTEAAQLSGFTIWDATHKVIGPPSLPSLGLGLYQSDIQNYARMFRRGDSVSLSDLCASLDLFVKRMHLTASTEDAVTQWIKNDIFAPNPSKRTFANFIHSLSLEHGNAGAIFGGPNERMDPIQTLLVLRAVGEDLASPIRQLGKQINADHKVGGLPHPTRKFLAQGRPENGAVVTTALLQNTFAASPAHLLGQLTRELLPISTPGEDSANDFFTQGATEDGVVAATTWLHDKGIDALKDIAQGNGNNATATQLQYYTENKAIANMVLSLVKFAATYLAVECKFSLKSPPGAPLVRNKDTRPGEERTVIAHWYLDPAVAADTVKQLRVQLGVSGLDFDMPAAGPLSDVETEWELIGSVPLTGHPLVDLPNGELQHKIRTDGNGDAKVVLRGKAREQAIPEATAVPVMKTVSVKVTPQVKADGAHQDITDAILSVLAVKGGRAGWLTPLMEFLYRCKWACARQYNVPVRDWVPGDYVGRITLDATGSGRHFGANSQGGATIKRHLEAEDLTLNESVASENTQVPPEILRMQLQGAKNDAERAQMKQALDDLQQRLKEAAGKITFSLKTNGSYKPPGSVSASIDDHAFSKMEVEECEREVSTSDRVTTGSEHFELGVEDKHRFDVQVTVDPKNSVAWVKIESQIKTVTTTVTTANGETKSETSPARNTEVVPGLKFANPSEALLKGFKIPLTVKKDAANLKTDIDKAARYSGFGIIPFTFGKGYKGQLAITVSIYVLGKKSK